MAIASAAVEAINVSNTKIADGTVPSQIWLRTPVGTALFGGPDMTDASGIPLAADVPVSVDVTQGEALYVRSTVASDDEVDTIAIVADSGTYTVSVNGHATTNIAAAADATAVQAALVALPNVVTGDVVVTGTPTLFTLTYAQAFSQLAVVTTTDPALLVGTPHSAAVVVSTPGGNASDTVYVLHH